MIIIGGLVVAGLMLALWLLHFPMSNAAIVDAGWAGGLAILGVLYAALGTGAPARRYLIGAMAGLWGFRLALHLLADRILGHPEEGRYRELRRQWRTHIPMKFLLFFEFQALLCLVLAAPFYLAASNPAPEISGLEYAGIAIWLAAIAGESIADRQLAAFKRDPANKGKTCRIGLWNYSRHPNYFFEWLIWVAFALFALDSPNGWAGLISPALMLYFLFKVTGIPATEAQALRSRGEDYRRYQQTTSAFVPWFPRRSSG
jgi:steroid 5-alpha reductase family enzyme